MPTVFIPVQWRDLTPGVERVEIRGATVRQVIAVLEEMFPGIAARAKNGDTLASGLSVSIDGVMTNRMLAPILSTSEVHFLPAIGGG